MAKPSKLELHNEDQRNNQTREDFHIDLNLNMDFFSFQYGFPYCPSASTSPTHAGKPPPHHHHHCHHDMLSQPKPVSQVLLFWFDVKADLPLLPTEWKIDQFVSLQTIQGIRYQNFGTNLLQTFEGNINQTFGENLVSV